MTFSKSKLAILLLSLTLALPSLAASLEETQRLANQGYVDAQNNLGLMYYDGEGVRQDYAKAAEWYQKAANQGVGQAQFNLGVMYYNGQGVHRNIAVAKEWFGKSCDNGDQNGCDNYRKLN